MLTLGWRGACTSGAIIPNVSIVEDARSQSPPETLRRTKRTPDDPLVKRNRAFHGFCKVVFTSVRGE